jgi:hypothetical protein
MNESSYARQLASLVDAMRESTVTRVLELGTEDESFLASVVREADWAKSIELHCVDNGNDSFDSKLTAAAENTSVDFNVIKHVGSETDVSDAIMQVAETSLFDAVFIAGATSSEALLAACMVCNEVLRPEGIMAISVAVREQDSMGAAMASFRDMFGDSYEEFGEGLLRKQ